MEFPNHFSPIPGYRFMTLAEQADVIPGAMVRIQTRDHNPCVIIYQVEVIEIVPGGGIWEGCTHIQIRIIDELHPLDPDRTLVRWEQTTTLITPRTDADPPIVPHNYHNDAGMSDDSDDSGVC